MEIANEHNFIVIEDSAQCVLGMYKGRIAGGIGHMGCFSFEARKHLSIGEGGMVITNDECLAERVRRCGGVGYKNLRAEEGRMQTVPSAFQDPDYKRHDFFGWNYRMPEICAANFGSASYKSRGRRFIQSKSGPSQNKLVQERRMEKDTTGKGEGYWGI